MFFTCIDLYFFQCVEKDSISLFFFQARENFNVPLFSFLTPPKPKCWDNHGDLFPDFYTYFKMIIRYLTIIFTDLFACHDFLFLHLSISYVISFFFLLGVPIPVISDMYFCYHLIQIVYFPSWFLLWPMYLELCCLTYKHFEIM